jgi:hypothetical protein
MRELGRVTPWLLCGGGPVTRLSHANKRRHAALARTAVLDGARSSPKAFSGICGWTSWQRISSAFSSRHSCGGLQHHRADSPCIDWAQHRRRKAAAKLHVRLDLHSLLPRFVLVESAKAADSIRAAEVCAGVKPGEIVIFDRAYVDFIPLGVLHGDGVFWVTRREESLCFRVVKRLPKATDKRILSDELVVLKNKDSRANYTQPMRQVRALVEVDGKEREMEILTNNITWSAATVADLYRCRWQIEVFFKRIKQSLQLCDFLGNSPNASAGRSGRRCCSTSLCAFSA